MPKNKKGMKFRVRKMEKLMGISRQTPIGFVSSPVSDPIVVGTQVFHVKRFNEYGQG